jgi:hypothetical protein
MDLIMEIDSDCVLSGSRVSRWDRQRVVILQTINDSLPSRVNLSQFVPEKPLSS